MMLTQMMLVSHLRRSETLPVPRGKVALQLVRLPMNMVPRYRKIVIAAIWNKMPPTMISAPSRVPECAFDVAAIAPPTDCKIRLTRSHRTKNQRYVLGLR